MPAQTFFGVLFVCARKEAVAASTSIDEMSAFRRVLKIQIGNNAPHGIQSKSGMLAGWFPGPNFIKRYSNSRAFCAGMSTDVGNT